MLGLKFFSGIAAAAFTLSAIAITVRTALAQRKFIIRNNTGSDIVSLQVSSAGSGVWGTDELGPWAMADGDTVTVKVSGDCLYDIKALLIDGREIERRLVDTCSSAFFGLAIRESFPVARGFFCSSASGVPETRYQNSTGKAEVWIRWQSEFFAAGGYDPLTRCQEVSDRLETYRRNDRLNYIGIGRMNGQNIICAQASPQNCVGLIYTLKPTQDPAATLEQFMQHRMGLAGTAPLYESADPDEDAAPDATGASYYIDVRPFLERDSDNPDSDSPDSETAPATPATSPFPNNAPNKNPPQTQEPREGGGLRQL
ncbi:MAG: hypothetical protein F6J93_22010 [Oscillatoria sp. SIO1A7]|nr:hypothetical protein [Oscillatoria sp. SIO1A7]